ncbi:DUF2892 domain-containing protein [Brucella gallinifaecis]|uniref:DUF2892 domain-containing protein n=1 Tax=Brucella gallinifaecis TaxID=215590 RepID=A0A502BLC1_9HYPH|nr:DUF2892 domain-containing protein [Brucella gallinifaecis]TPF74188.1 DUF2892 domain-containing protein [Brucella gallinifaecis]
MIKNIGQTERILRLIAGIAVAVIAWFYGGDGALLGYILWIIAAVLVLTSLFAVCPAYRLFGFSTCPLKRK